MRIQPDTLTLDTRLLQQMQQNSDYDYNREILHEDTDMLDGLQQALERLVDSIFGSHFYSEHHIAICVTITLVGLALLTFLICQSHPAWFSRQKKVPTDDTSSEDNIYGVDFTKDIRRAWTENNYRQVVRLVYLQTLRVLADHQLIHWRLSKTPTQYTREYRSHAFLMMTNRFLRVRYGDFPADNNLAETMQQLQHDVLQEAGLNHSDHEDTPAKAMKQKGGGQ